MSISKQQIAEQYPGFPDFIHEIMVHIGNGKTADEAAELVNAPAIMQHIEERIKLEESRRASDPYKEGHVECILHDDNLCPMID